MSEKFAYWQRKKSLQFGCVLEKLLKKSSLQFYVFHNEGFGHRTIQSYVEEQHVKIIYTQWKLKWIDILRLVSNYNARKHRTIGMRPVDVTPAIANRRS